MIDLLKEIHSTFQRDHFQDLKNLLIRMEKNDRTCETKDPVYIYILFYSRLNSSVSLPFSSLLSRRISRISWRGSGRRGRAIDLISRRYSFPRRWTAEAQIAHTYVRSPIPARRSTSKRSRTPIETNVAVVAANVFPRPSIRLSPLGSP